jgi:hypothetical protein
MRRSLLAITCGSALLLVAAPSPCEEGNDATRARSLYDAGIDAFADKRFVEAALAFEAAAAIKPNPISFYTAGRSWDQADALARAADDYSRALANPGLALEAADHARQRLASLEQVLGGLNVTGPQSWRVQIDANAEASPPTTLHGAAGTHTLLVRREGQPIVRLPIVLSPGVRTAVDVGSLPASSESEALATPGQARLKGERDLLRTLGGAAFGAGGAAALAAALLGVEALDARDAYVASPTKATFDHAHALETWTNVSIVMAGLLVAGGFALTLWPFQNAPAGAPAKTGSVSITAGPTGLVVRGGFGE